MTLIATIKTRDSIIFAADRASFDNSHIWRTRGMYSSSAKIVHTGNMIAGCTGAKSVVNLLRYKVKFSYVEDQNPEEYLVNTFVPAWRKVLEEAGQTSKESDGTDSYDGRLMIGIIGESPELFLVDTCGGVTLIADEYAAVGSPSSIALGALAVTSSRQPERRLRDALFAAEYWTGEAIRPFDFVEIRRRQQPRFTVVGENNEK